MITNSGTKTAFTTRNTASAQLGRAVKGRGGVVTGVDLDAARQASRAISSTSMIGCVPVEKYAEIADSPGFPQAPGWRLIIIPVKPPEKSAGGIIYSDETVFANEVLADVGYVASVGPVAFKDPRFLKSDAWAKRGDWVNYGRLNGKDILFVDASGETHRLHVCNDKDVLMILPNPNAIKVF